MAKPGPACLRLLALMLACATAPAAVVHVKADAGGAGNGSSWTDAYPSLASAIAASKAGDELWIAAGTYRPGTSRSSTFTLKAGTRSYGGFRGTETALEQRSGDPGLTVLSGDIGVAGVATDNTYHVVWIEQAGTYALADLTITGGYGDGPNTNVDDTGGGLVVKSPVFAQIAADLTLDNCVVSGNAARNCTAISADSSATLRFRRCLVVGNRQTPGTAGGHTAILGSAAFTGTAELDRCIFAGNQAVDPSASYVLYSTMAATASNCLFADNQLKGPYFGNQATLNACTFAGNRTLNLDRAGSATVVTANSIVMSPYQAGMSHVHSWWDGDHPGEAPGFLDPGHPAGADGLWLTADDGYQLRADSILVDPALTVVLAFPADDLRGLARPQGRRCDLGSYERDQGGQAPVAASQDVSGIEDTDLAIAVLGSDADSAVLTGRILSLPARGSLLPTLDGVTPAGPALTVAELPWRIPDSQRRVLYRPPPDANGGGLASFIVDLDDGSHTSFPATITIAVTAVNDPPTLDALANQLLSEDTASSVILTGISAGTPALADGAPGKEAQVLTITATSADHSLLPDPAVAYTSPATSAVLTLVPARDAFGTTTLTVTVSDEAGFTTTRTCTVRVDGVNDPPLLVMSVSVATSEDLDCLATGLFFGAGPDNEAAQLPNVRVIASAVDPTLVTVTGIDFTPVSGSEVVVHLHPMPNASGHTQVAVTAIDDVRFTGGPLATTQLVDVWVTAVNDPPVLVRNLPQAVTRGGRAVLGSANLLISDPDSPPPVDLRLILTVLPEHGTVELDLAPLAVGSGFTLQDLTAGKVSYRHDGSPAAGDVFTAEFTDGIIARPYPSVAVPVSVDGKVLPLVTLPAIGPTWHEGEPPLALAPSATVSDADSELMAAGQVTVTDAGGNAGDLLAIANQGAGAGQIALSGTTVRFGGRAIGSWQGGSGGRPLVVALAGADATLEAVQALVRALTFGHAGGDPGSATRTVTVVVDDGDSGASPPATTTVAVVPRDDPPTIRTSTLSIPAGATLALELAAEDNDSPLLTWSLVTAPARAACTLVDSARGRLRLTAPADARGSDRIGVTVSDGANPPVSAAILLVITGPDDLRPLPAAEFPGEAFADEVLRVDIPWDCRLLPGARLAFAATTDAPAGLALTATGATSVRATWAVPAGEPPGHRRFAIIASDTVSGASGLLPVLLPVRARPGASN
ncbi:MAG: Ig-like domain-containing protein [Planctomycetes bacterium]|nr:Ig-like domain-containing protein [Planctomycetota bacterium]